MKEDLWKNLSGEDFEKLIFNLLGRYNFKNRIWYGKGGGDKGRDIVAVTTESLPLGFEFQRKWVIQCKRWAKFPPKNVIDEAISSAKEHEPDFWLLATTADPSPNLLDFIFSFDKKYGFRVLLWTGVHIEEELQKHWDLKETLSGKEDAYMDDALYANNGKEVYYNERDNSITVKSGKVEKIVCDENPSLPMISPDNTKIAYISPFEWEMVGELFVYNTLTDSADRIISYSDLPNQFTPKEIVWLDNDYLLVIIGFAYGTVTQGGDLYIINTTTKRLFKFMESKERQEFKNINVDDNCINLQIVNFDEDYNDFTIFQEKIDLSYITEVAVSID